MDNMGSCSNTTSKNKKLPILDSDSSEISSTKSITEEIRLSNTDILREDAMVGDSEFETNSSNLYEVDHMQTNSRKNSEIKIISNIEISGISSFLNIGDVSNTEGVSLSDLNLIDPMRFDQVTEDSPKLLCGENIKKPRRKRIRACRKFAKSQKIDSETDNQDFSPSDGSDFDPDLCNQSSDDSMTVVSLSDVRNHPDNKRFWKKYLLEKHGSSPVIIPLKPSFPKLSEKNDQISEDNFSNSKQKCTEKWVKNNRTVTRKQKLECTIEQDVPPNDDTPSSMIIIEDQYDAEADSEESIPDLQNKQPEQPEDPKKKRKWVRRNACIFCENVVTNFTRHLLNHHQNESEVLQYLSITDSDPKVRQRRRREISDDLRNRGNFLHNSKVIFEKEGDLIPKKGKYPLSSPSTFTACKNCLGTFKRKYFYKHFKTCGSKFLEIKKISDTYKKRVLQNHSISIIPHLSAASQELKDHILPRLRNDDISMLVKTDSLIMAYGSRLMKKKKEARSRKAICSKLRDLGNLLLHLKTEDPTIQELSELFKPQHYTTFMNCVKKMCGFNDETGFVETISIPSRLRPSVLGCIEVLYTEMIMGHGSQAYKDTLKKQLDEFKLLIQINWEWEISSNAEKTRKRNLMTKETMMPLDEDIQKITEKIHELEKRYSKQLKNDVTVLNYENLCEVTIAHIIVMDKKRAGDVAEAELCFYLNRKDEETPSKVLELLSQEQKEAIDQLDVFMIPGKRTRSVPILLTKQMRRNIDLIVVNRKLVGVADNNPLLFARPLTSRPFDGGKCLNKIKSMCKLKNPKMLTSTGVRHHVATMSQLHAKKNDQYTEHLAGFMGHDLAVHSSNYRLPLQVIQKAIIGTSLMEFEKNKKNKTVELVSEKGSDKSINKKPETVTSKSIELEKRSDDSNKTITHTELQSKETERATQENYLIPQTKQQESPDVMNICQFQLEKEENKRKLKNYQTGKEMQDKNYSEDTDETAENAKLRIQERYPSENLVEDKLCELRQKKAENEKKLDNDQGGEKMQETNYSEGTDETVESAKHGIQEQHPNENLVEDKLCELRQKKSENEKKLESDQAGEKMQETNYSDDADETAENAKFRIQERYPSENLVEDKLCELRRKKAENEKNLENDQGGEKIQETNYSEGTDETVENAKHGIQEQHLKENLVEDKLCELRQKKSENEKKLENDQAGEKMQETNYSEGTDETVENAKNRIQEQHPNENLVEDKLCELNQKKISDTAQDFPKLHDRNEVSQANIIVRNVKGQFRSDPHKSTDYKSKIHKHKQETYSEKSSLQNAASNDDEENQIIAVEKLNSKSDESSNDSSDKKSINPKIDGLKDYKVTRKRKAQNISEESPSSSDELLSLVETRRRKKTHTRWTNEELKAVRTYFKDNIKKKINPGKAKCLEVLKKAPVLSRRTWMQINTQVNNIYKKKI